MFSTEKNCREAEKSIYFQENSALSLKPIEFPVTKVK